MTNFSRNISGLKVVGDMAAPTGPRTLSPSDGRTAGDPALHPGSLTLETPGLEASAQATPAQVNPALESLESEQCPRCGAPLRVREHRLRRLAGMEPRLLRAVLPCAPCMAVQQAREESLRRREQFHQMLTESGIPMAARCLSLNPDVWIELRYDPMNMAVIQRLRIWLSEGSSVYVCGPPGSGKTLLALAASMDLLRASPPQRLRYVRDQDFLGLVWGRWQDDVAAQSLRQLGRIPVLVLDDLGRHRLTDAVREALFDLLNERCQVLGSGKKTLVTGNMPLEELLPWLEGGGPERSAGALASRFMDLIQGESVQLLGGDRRQSWRSRTP